MSVDFANSIFAVQWGSGGGEMKKFLEKKVMDYKFRRAGEGHRLDEEKPQAQPVASRPGCKLVCREPRLDN